MDDLPLADLQDEYADGIDEPSVDVRDSPILRRFVLQVIVWNLALLAMSLGLFLIYFEGDWERGGQLVVAAAGLALYGAYRWPRGDDQEADSS